MDGKSGPIGGLRPDPFALRRGPNGVYLSDGRFIPSRNDATAGVDNSQAVIDVHGQGDIRERGMGVLGRIDVK